MAVKPVKTITINSTKYKVNSDGIWLNIKVQAGSPYTVTEIEASDNLDLTSYTMQDLMEDVINGHLMVTFQVTGGDIARYILVADVIETGYNDDTHQWTYAISASGFTRNEGAGRFAFYMSTRGIDANELVSVLASTKNQVSFNTGSISWN